MARCLLCDKFGWFLSTTRDGLCETCDQGLVQEVPSTVRVINQSLEIATSSKKLDTILSRFGVAENGCRKLRKYERRGVSTTNPAPSELIERIASTRRSTVLSWIDRELLAARAKSEVATTPAGKIGGYTKLLETINTIYAEVDDIAELWDAETAVRQELDSVRLKTEIDRGARLVFKGQKKRACEAYLDALYLLRGDSIPDHQQQAEIKEIENKIRSLGGEVPPYE